MTEENRPDQPAKPSSPAPKKRGAAAKESGTPLVAPLASLGEPPSTTIETGQYAWDENQSELVITPEDLEGAVVKNEERKLPRSNAHPPCAWVWGPGIFQPLVETVKLIKGAAKAAGTQMNAIEAVYAMALPKLNVVLVKAVKKGSDGANPAHGKGRGPRTFNLSEILREAGMEVTSGYKERFPVKKVAESPIGPCIAIVMAKSLETKMVKAQKGEEGK